MSPVFTVLVPVCNVGEYLKKCLDSLLEQSFSNIEIICVNDGSTDDSGIILHEYAEKDKRILLIERENKGYGATLNEALLYAKGDYISIVEPDDFLDLKAYEFFYRDVQECPTADIIKYSYWDYMMEGDAEKIRPSAMEELDVPKKMFRITEYPELLLYHPSIWSCVYKKSFLSENNITFVEAKGAAWVDNPFFIQTMCLAENIVCKKQKVYFYRQGHTTASSNLKDCTIPLLRLLEILDFLEQKQMDDYGVLVSVYRRVLNYIQIVRGSQCYEHDRAELLISNIEKRLKPEVVFSGCFSREEEDILSEYADETARDKHRKTEEQQFGELFETGKKQWRQLEDHRARLDGMEVRLEQLERMSKSAILEEQGHWERLDARIGQLEEVVDEREQLLNRITALEQKQEEMQEEMQEKISKSREQLYNQIQQYADEQERLRLHLAEMDERQNDFLSELNQMKKSHSYRIGRVITWIPRKLKNLLLDTREEQENE